MKPSVGTGGMDPLNDVIVVTCNRVNNSKTRTEVRDSIGICDGINLSVETS